ncbi:DMT family transporter [Bdellovibrio bacteriovorus]|uniref:Transporter n=1 Tax=Bdellovibrio bacteriovorus TaxID=959 RepID=A0A150WTM3_BDEBC|nr:EamA family transporter [Bdellovibrio bacteriovorus]KYG67689.1 transporter [Bdellovibrio bacteriovorus]
MKSLYSSLGLLLIAMFSIQFGASFAKQLFPLAGAAGATALRVFISALVLSVVAKIWKHKISKKEILPIAAYGISLGAMNLLFYFSLERIPLGIAVAVEFVGPLSVALFSSKKSWDILWVALAGAGIYMLLPVASSSTAALDGLGVFLALAAGFFWALYIVFGKKISKATGSLQTTSWGMWFAALVTVPAGFIFNGKQILDPSLLPMGLAIALLSSAIPYSLEMKAMTNIPTKTFGILMSMEPVVAIFAGFVMLNESLTLTQSVAVACIIAASAGSTATAK